MNRNIFLPVCLLGAVGIGAIGACGKAQQNPAGLVAPQTAAISDTFVPLLPEDTFLNGGMLGLRVDANEKHRMLLVDENDMLDAFERRSVPHQDWQGEHVGKYLHAATLAWNYTRDPQLKTKLDRVAERLLKTQEADGYLGTYKPDHRWTSWDVWVHKYDLLGLLTYYQYTKLANNDQPTPTGTAALDACRKIGDLLLKTFGKEPGKRDINKSGEHVGMAPDSVLEPVVLLYRATNDKRYLGFAQYIVRNYDAPGGPAILASLESKKTVRAVANAKAYEMTSNFNGLLELYRVTGQKRLLEDMQIAWQDIVKNRLYLTGSASSFEVFQDENHLPNGMNSNICETCVTVTWEQMNLQLLRLTGESKYADELEKSVYNHLFAAQKPTGDDWAYYTPLDGHKPYDAATTCCHSSGPRGVALIPAFATMTSSDGGLVVNLYNTSRTRTRLPSGIVTLEQTTNYPVDGNIKFKITPEKNSQSFMLRLRVPAWAKKFLVTVNGKETDVPFKQGYAVLERGWRQDDTVQVLCEMPDRAVFGDHENGGKAAIQHGPLVLALDTITNEEVRSLKRAALGLEPGKAPLLTYRPERSKPDAPAFGFTGEIAGKGRQNLLLIPYASAGADGKSRFSVWIPLSTVNLSGADSLFAGSPWGSSRKGNQMGAINDDDTTTFAVTYDTTKEETDWFAVRLAKPVKVGRVVFAHGKTFHDGGWFDTGGGKKKPQIQVQTEVGSEWRTVGILDSYPATTATDAAGLKEGQKFEIKFPAMNVVAVRVTGKPASGDNIAQTFSSCAELQAFGE